MTQRERVMAGAIAGVVAVVGGIALVRSSVIAPLKAKHAEYEALQQRFEQLNGRLAHEASSRARWVERTGRMLPGSPAEAHAIFRADLVKLLEQHGFHNVSLQPRDPASEKKGPRAGFVELPVSVSADASLAQVVDFLRDLYARPYFARVTRLSLTAGSASANRPAPSTPRAAGRPALDRNRPRNGSAGGDARPAAGSAAASASKDEPNLSVTFVASALLLPAKEGVPTRPLDPNQFAALPDPDLLAQEDRSVYNDVVRINMFKVWTPTATPSVAVEGPKTEPNTPAPVETHKPPERDPRQFADKLTLVCTTSVSTDSGERALIALVRDERSRDEPAKRYALNDELDDGKVVVIHPTGIVVRTHGGAAHGARGGGHDGPATDYFYPLGKNFRERQALDPALQPEVAADLRRAFPALPQ